MDNFRKPKKHSAGSLDGFVRPVSGGSNKKDNLQAFNQYYPGQARSDTGENLRVDRIDDFKLPGGFQPTTQAPIGRPGAYNKPDELGMEPESGPVPGHKKSKSIFLHRHKKKSDAKSEKVRSKHHKLKLGLKISGALALILILVAGGLGLKAYLKARNVFRGGSNGAAALDKNVDPLKLKGEGDGRVNILLLGKGGIGHDGPDLTDTIMIASIDPVAKETALLSIPRDLWVKTSGGGASKINAVYANAKYSVLNSYTTKQQTADIKQKAENAGIKALEETLTTVGGIPIHYFAMVDFEGFRQAIDSVGGIDINVKTQVYDTFVMADNNGNPLIAAVGQQHFNGKRALLYAQSRHGSARGDFDRAERQREVIVALKTKALSLGTLANPLKVNQLIGAIGNHISTDMTLNELMRVYDIAKGIDAAKIQSIGLADPPNNFVTTDNVNGQSVVRPRVGLFDYSEIQSYVRNALRDSFLKSENASIIILNGTNTPGLATLKSTELKSYGYNVTSVGDAPTKTYAKTTLIDLTKGVKKYTKNYLEKRLGVTSTTSLPDTSIVPGTADFVIILGSSEASAAQ